MLMFNVNGIEGIFAYIWMNFGSFAQRFTFVSMQICFEIYLNAIGKTDYFFVNGQNFVQRCILNNRFSMYDYCDYWKWPWLEL